MHGLGSKGALCDLPNAIIFIIMHFVPLIYYGQKVQPIRLLIVAGVVATGILLWRFLGVNKGRIIYKLLYRNKAAAFNTYFATLYSKFKYFTLLSDAEQHEFANRLQFVRNTKVFTGLGLTITDEMEILVSAALVQLTFGLNKFSVENVYEIQLAPADFYSPMLGRRAKGLTFESGKVILSWVDFKEGYRVGDDKINLGLHELAHALWEGQFADGSLDNAFDTFTHAALAQMQADRTENGIHFMRDYADTNIEEFWACSVECFFEAPTEFKRQLPELYGKISNVLQQDMAARLSRGVLQSV